MSISAERRPAVSIVVPTLGEERAIAANLAGAVAQADEVVVCDGGSRDGTVAAAREAGARVISAPRGRGVQLNRGAEAAERGEILLFLHADTRLPEGGVEAVRAAVLDGAVGGGFLVRFDARPAAYRLGERVVNWRSRVLGTPLGDQAQFATRRVFREIGGFPPWPLLEDLDFIRRLKRRGRIAVLEPPVLTSARRFEQGGLLPTLARNWLLFALYLVGVPPPKLERLYPPREVSRD